MPTLFRDAPGISVNLHVLILMDIHIHTWF
jgi:hypothetical protein